jgi:hypothetical protein
MTRGRRSRRTHLLNLPQGFDELLNESQVWTQPPEQEEKQQGHQNNNYQVFQIKFPAIRSSFLLQTTFSSLLTARLFCTSATFFTSIRQIIFAPAWKRIDVPPPGR